MYSYIALTWDVRDVDKQVLTSVTLRQQIRALNNYQTVLSAPGIFVAQKPGFRSACCACKLPDADGVVLGTLFAWPTAGGVPERKVSLSEHEAREIVRTYGAHLITSFWGRYVAFVRIAPGDRYVVIRDPSGMLPCFIVTHAGVHVWFSNLPDLTSLKLTCGGIDWPYIEKHVAQRFVVSTGTGLSGVQEVRAGERCEVMQGHLKREQLWDAAVVSRMDVIENSELAAVQLRSLTRACVDAWALAYETMLLTLSGGLDSSIVAAMVALTPRPTSVTCLNYYAVELAGDERFYARLAADRAGFDLIEKRRVPQLVKLRKLLDITATPNPWYYRYEVEHGDYENAQAELRSVAAIFTGEGGDGIFYQSQSGLSVADYIQARGLTSELLGIALDAARLEGASLVSVLLNAFAVRHSTSRWNPSVACQSRQRFVAADIVAPQTASLRARFGSSPYGVPPGKSWHIETTSIAPRFYDVYDSALSVERVPPLVSQPIVEHCLRIPTYVLAENGWDRAVARRAFESDLPRPIVNRRGKGTITAHVRAVFDANIDFVRELLLDGVLTRSGILDRGRLESCISGSAAALDAEITEILDHLSTEAWIHCQAARGK